MSAASEARRIALMLNDSKWQEIEEEIRKAIEAAHECPYEMDLHILVGPPWRDQPDGVR